MASSNRDPVVNSVDDDNSPIMQRAIATVADLMKEGERLGEARARVHFTAIITDLEASLEAANEEVADLARSLEAEAEHNGDLEVSLKDWQDRATKAEASAARLKSDYQEGAQLLFKLGKTFEEKGNDTAENESAGSAADVNSSANTEQQSNRPEQQMSPSGSDTSTDARIKREESSLFIDDQSSDGNGIIDIASISSYEEIVPPPESPVDGPVDGPVFQYLRVDEIDMMRDDAAVSRLWEAAEGHKRRRTE